jgi:large subunit ribosomal protein L9
MKVLLLKDVYKLGRAGDIKKVADGFGRNFLLPQGLAVLATPGAIKKAEFIRASAAASRTVLNNEMAGVAEKLNGLMVAFPSKAGETGKLYGSITTQMIAEAITKRSGVTVERRQIEVQPIRTLGEHKARVRLTIDLVPEIKVYVHREGEKVVIEETAAPAAEEVAAEAAE